MPHAKAYITYPYSFREKGPIGNTHKLIRQYIPKDTDFSTLSDVYIIHVQTKLNKCSRKLLDFDTPK